MKRPITSGTASSGFTLVEVAIAAVILSMILGAVVAVQGSLGGLNSTTSVSGTMVAKAQGAIEIMSAELRWAEGGSVILLAENGSARVEFQVPVDWVAGAPVWSSRIVYRVLPSTIDANDDGVLDEGRLVREQDGLTRVLAENVVLGGFTTNRAEENLVLGLQVSKINHETGQVLGGNAQTSISFRN